MHCHMLVHLARAFGCCSSRSYPNTMPCPAKQCPVCLHAGLQQWNTAVLTWSTNSSVVFVSTSFSLRSTPLKIRASRTVVAAECVSNCSTCRQIGKPAAP